MNDSKLIVEWANGNYKFENLLIAYIMERIREVRHCLIYLIQTCILETQHDAYLLPKEALKTQEGMTKIEEVEGHALAGITLYISRNRSSDG